MRGLPSYTVTYVHTEYGWCPQMDADMPASLAATLLIADTSPPTVDDLRRAQELVARYFRGDEFESSSNLPGLPLN